MLELITSHNELYDLKKVSLETLNKNCKDILRKDPIKIFNFINNQEASKELKGIFLKTICKNPELLFNSNELPTLEKDALVMVLKCDNLNMKEMDIWKRLIQWGIAQHKTLRQDVTKFTHEDFKMLKKTLHELIQLVRFHQMKREEFMIEVWPFRHLLPDNLIEDILRYYLISGSVPHSNAFPIRLGNINIKFDIKIDSVIINKRIALLLTKWIDEKTIVNKQSKKVIYNFNLLFRSSIDGFSSQIFHQKCDNKKSTIVIAKISNSNMLIGGYNPLYWSGNGYKSTTNSFIFSFNDFNDPQSAKLGRVTNSEYAVYCHNNFGPSFGHDLCVPNNSNNWQYHKTSYPNIEVPNSFTISEYEVFQIVKR
ncbi:btb/poz domain-containing protein 19-like [Gigaspora margarita]|uniref:Btb/poz domain-containing protein 19-like n=1 Tax=Gigaspora margarita TaxID=4874 RepID=A0A8H4A473_GIGMA|nr:btb/poz domain-containing protein 19-like [Gigaspora margarita]